MTYTLHNTDVLEGMKLLDDKSIDCVITSPPYWQLRDYGFTGQWGLEPTYQEYLEHLWSFIDEVWRVLKDTGTVWINLGDTYGSFRGANGTKPDSFERKLGKTENDKHVTSRPSFMRKEFNKCLLLIPHRFAIGCIDRGWILRNDIIWAKRNGMPESCRDRFSKKHEFVFFLSKSSDTLLWYHSRKKIWIDTEPEPEYIWINIESSEESDSEPPENPLINKTVTTKIDKEISEEISLPHAQREVRLWQKKNLWQGRDYYFDLDPIKVKSVYIERWGKVGNRGEQKQGFQDHQKYNETKNPGDVSDFWDISTKSNSEKHYATFNSELIDKPIVAGCPEGGTILDPFAGTGTTLLRALQLNRNVIGIEGKEEYVSIIKSKIDNYLKQLNLFK